MSKCVEDNYEITIDFDGLFQNASKVNKYLIESIYHFNGWPQAKLLTKPETVRVIVFLKEYKAIHGIRPDYQI